MARKMVVTASVVAAWRWPSCMPNDYPCTWNAFPITRSKRMMVASKEGGPPVGRGDSGRPIRLHGTGGHHATASRCMARGSATRLENNTATSLFNVSDARFIREACRAQASSGVPRSGTGAPRRRAAAWTARQEEQSRQHVGGASQAPTERLTAGRKSNAPAWSRGPRPGLTLPEGTQAGDRCGHLWTPPLGQGKTSGSP